MVHLFLDDDEIQDAFKRLERLTETEERMAVASTYAQSRQVEHSVDGVRNVVDNISMNLSGLSDQMSTIMMQIQGTNLLSFAK